MAYRGGVLVLGLAMLVVTACAASTPTPSSSTGSAPAATSAPAPTAAAAAQQRVAAAVPAASPAAAANAQAGGAAPTSSAGDQQLAVGQNIGRMVIYTTSLTVLAEDLDRFPNDVGALALTHGGFVGGIESKDDGGIQALIVTLKVPPDQYEAVMRGLRSMSVEVRDQKAATQDVTEEYSDTQTQIASLEATHAELLELMKRSGSVDELLKVQQQAAQVKLQLDRLKGRSTALERLTSLATITVKAQLASAVLRRDVTSVRAALRQAESARSSLQLELQRARTPEDEARVRDKLGETQLQIDENNARLDDLTRKAAAVHVTLPTAETEQVAQDPLTKQFIDTRVALRKAQAEHDSIAAGLRVGRPDASPDRLSAAILQVSTLTAQLKTVQDRANQTGVTLPALSADEEALLSGTAQPRSAFEVPGPIRSGWEASLAFLVTVAGGVVFFWWLVPVLAVLLVVARFVPGARRTSRTAPTP